MSLIEEADRFAEVCHAGVFRKYNGLPYINHPRRVAAMVAKHRIADDDLIASALLHDVVEDCGVSVEELEAKFGVAVAAVVELLSNPSKGMNASREERKRIDREHAAGMPPDVKVIKLMDRLDNLREMDPVADPDFCRLYAAESRLLLDVIGHADLSLRDACLKEISVLECA